MLAQHTRLETARTFGWSISKTAVPCGHSRRYAQGVQSCGDDHRLRYTCVTRGAEKVVEESRLHTVETRKGSLAFGAPRIGKYPGQIRVLRSLDEHLRVFVGDQRLRAQGVQRAPSRHQERGIADTANDVPVVVVGTERPKLGPDSGAVLTVAPPIRIGQNAPTYPRYLRGHPHSSRNTVTGPSFTNSTCIFAPNTPVVRTWAAQPAQCVRERRDQRLGERGGSGCVPGRPASLRGVGVERELTDHQNRRIDIRCGTFVGENT